MWVFVIFREMKHRRRPPPVMGPVDERIPGWPDGSRPVDSLFGKPFDATCISAYRRGDFAPPSTFHSAAINWQTIGTCTTRSVPGSLKEFQKEFVSEHRIARLNVLNAFNA